MSNGDEEEEEEEEEGEEEVEEKRVKKSRRAREIVTFVLPAPLFSYSHLEPPWTTRTKSCLSDHTMLRSVLIRLSRPFSDQGKCATGATKKLAWVSFWPRVRRYEALAGKESGGHATGI